ncbi:LEAF RUST 10 DISEASE-RESISTANCE LOCUS RECEPTOR-LIKE PROTEIN KINASE-like 1.2 isoform X2 [Herrania umbratica]|uniref:non-specific serine/threonine protein kinase n=1 Tax=Herrania umbratica TaxID=108875 RepID=A0A6J1AYB4_9ROSI|nr:LEAF RUST 10 DISEASE-RESISTANCE LOCUS RECEPTOR-LIKE PROTEIN KINASE-like 1.2 isoform X2 [Herrania umbratica]
MDLQNLLKLRTFLCIITISLTTLATETLSADSHFEACIPRSCGNGPNISYPFWISEEQESYCGYPNFQITCEGKNPALAISEDSFIIKDIFYDNNSLLVVNADVSEDDCPTPRQNLSLDRTPFSLSLVNVNLSFLYNCEERPEYHTYPVSCASNASFHSFAVFHKEGLEKTNYSLDSCQSSIDAPVYINDDVDFASLLEMNYTQVLSMGFVLNWTAHSCSNCNRSGGRCGFDNTSEFVCFCSDGSHPKTCNDGRGINWRAKLGIGFGAAFGGIIITCIGFFCWLRRRQGKVFFKSSFVSGKSSSDFSVMMDAEKGDSLAGVHLFSYEELQKATNKFDSDRELGEGGFGTVYYGKLRDGRVVAVKRLYENNYRRVEQFMNEVEILTRLRHKNLVSLYGCTSRHSRELLLVYEYIPNGTVADHLHGERAKPGALPWSIRLEIAIETAEALRFLHASDTIHRDVKTNNILLDNNFSVKVADFGLSRLFPTDVTHVSTAPQGTPGYVDPEYHQCYQLTDKSDVFSFGVVLVELISSKPAVDITRHRHEINLSNMAINKIQNRALHELIDPSLGFESDYKVRKMITGVAEVAFQCLQNVKDMRPTMEEVLEALVGIQNEDYNKEKAEDMDISADEVGLLKSGPVPLSPDSVMIKWISGSSTTPSISN